MSHSLLPRPLFQFPWNVVLSSYICSLIPLFWSSHVLLLFLVHCAGLSSYTCLLFLLREKLVFCSVPGFPLPRFPSYCTKLKCPNAWMLESSKGWGRMYFAFSSWSGPTKDHPANQRSFITVFFAITSSSLGSCFAIPFLLLILWFLLFGTCLGIFSFCNLFSPFLHIDSWLPRIYKLGNTRTFCLLTHNLSLFTSKIMHWLLLKCSPHSPRPLRYFFCPLHCISLCVIKNQPPMLPKR